MTPYNVGIVGYSWAATAHIAAINGTGRARVTAVCSSRPLDANQLSVRHGHSIAVFNDLAPMLRDPDIHVVSLCGYPYHRPQQTIAAARAGKHLILEKPLCLSSKDLHAMQAAVAAAGVRTCVCFECRYSSQFVTTKAVIDEGLLGTLHYGEVDYYHGLGPWYGQFRWNIRKDAGGSSLLTAGCHALDALLLCMDSPVTEVTSYDTKSRSTVFKRYQYPTTSVTIVKFASGAIGKCAAVVDCLQPYYFHTHLVGSHGSLLDNKFHSTKLRTDKHAWSTLAMNLLDSGDVSDHPYKTQFDAFFTALAQNRAMPLTSLDDAATSHEAIFAADRSARTGRPVRVAPVG